MKRVANPLLSSFGEETVAGGDAPIFPLAGAAGNVLLLLGLPAMWALQPYTGRPGQAGRLVPGHRSGHCPGGAGALTRKPGRCG